MKRTLLISFVLIAQIVCAQNVLVPRMEKIVGNNDKRLYKIADTINAQYLGELEIGGFTNDDALMFANIYQKAKKMGANAFQLRAIEDIDGTPKPFDPNHYFLSLYYKEDLDSIDEGNVAYLVGSPKKDLKIAIDQRKINLPARTFIKIPLKSGRIYSVSTRKLLGSTIRLSASQYQKSNYFQISGFGMRTDPSGRPGLNLKSGDILLLEKSYGMFLSIIYKQLDLEF